MSNPFAASWRRLSAATWARSLEFVRDCGVEYVQGFLFGKPDADPWSFIKKLDRKLFA